MIVFKLMLISLLHHIWFRIVIKIKLRIFLISLVCKKLKSLSLIHYYIKRASMMIILIKKEIVLVRKMEILLTLVIRKINNIELITQKTCKINVNHYMIRDLYFSKVKTFNFLGELNSFEPYQEGTQ